MGGGNDAGLVESHQRGKTAPFYDLGLAADVTVLACDAGREDDSRARGRRRVDRLSGWANRCNREPTTQQGSPDRAPP